eukprot:6046717-Amphidinium_carterae.1
MDDLHGACPDAELEGFLQTLGREVQIKCEGFNKVGTEYFHLKRPRRQMGEGTWVGANPKYIADLLKRLGLEGAKAAPTPATGDQDPAEENPDLDLEDVKLYRSCVGLLIYVALDRDDIQFEVSRLARKLKSPGLHDLRLLKRVGRYLKGTQKYQTLLPAIESPGGSVQLVGYSDSDWAGDRRERKSQSSGCVRADGCPLVSWSTRQAVVSLSSGEAEYYAACSVCSMLMFFREIYIFFGLAV